LSYNLFVRPLAEQEIGPVRFADEPDELVDVGQEIGAVNQSHRSGIPSPT